MEENTSEMQQKDGWKVVKVLRAVRTWTVLKTCLSLSPSGISMQILNAQLRRDIFVGLHFNFKNFKK